MASSSSTGRSNSQSTKQEFHDRPSNRDQIPSPPTSTDIGVGSNSTGAGGDTWDDDFEDVDEAVFKPSTFPADEDSANEEVGEEEGEEHESAVTIHVCFKENDASESNAEAGDRAVESVERGGGDTNGEDDGDQDGTQDQEEEEYSGVEARRMVRSMSPSPQPPLVQN